MITDKQKLSLVYFLTNCFFLASGYSLIYRLCGKDSWIAMIMGTVFGTIIISILNHSSFNKTKNYVLKNKLKNIERIIHLLFYSFIIFINITVVRIFTTSFLLTKTPGIFITIPFICLAYLCASKGLHTISKVSEILMPISLFIILINSLAVLKDGNISYFLPILAISKSKLFLGSIYFMIFTTIPNLLIFDIKIELKKHIKYYLTSSLITIIIGTIIIYVLGPSLIKIFRFPEYMVLKQLKIFNFVEKIENIAGMIWFFNLFISLSLSIYNSCKIINNDILIKIILGIIIIIVEFISKKYEYAMFIYKNLPYLLLPIGFIFFITILIIKKRYKKNSS